MCTKITASEVNDFRTLSGVLIAIAALGAVALVTIEFIAGTVAPRPEIRGALFMRSAYEDAGSEVVRQYRVALKRQSKAELCVIAGMIASVYVQANDVPAALAWKKQEGRDCSVAGMQSIWSDVRALTPPHTASE